MKTRLLSAVSACIVPLSLILNTAQANLIAKLTSKFLSLALLLILAQASSAATVPTVIYSFTSDDLVLNNPNGTWGGDLIVSAGQNVNVTVDYWFEANPYRITSGDEASFRMRRLQVFDNTNGLASDLIGLNTGNILLGSIDITYDGVMDRQTGAGYGTPGGSFFTEAIGEIGDAGGPLPTGSAFDMLIDSAFLATIIARAPDILSDNISGVNGTSLLPGNFTFQSRIGPSIGEIPIPGALVLFLSGMGGLGYLGVRRRIA